MSYLNYYQYHTFLRHPEKIDPNIMVELNAEVDGQTDRYTARYADYMDYLTSPENVILTTVGPITPRWLVQVVRYTLSDGRQARNMRHLFEQLGLVVEASLWLRIGNRRHMNYKTKVVLGRVYVKAAHITSVFSNDFEVKMDGWMHVEQNGRQHKLSHNHHRVTVNYYRVYTP